MPVDIIVRNTRAGWSGRYDGWRFRYPMRWEMGSVQCGIDASRAGPAYPLPAFPALKASLRLKRNKVHRKRCFAHTLIAAEIWG